MLTQLDDPSKVTEVVNQHWQELWRITEQQRFSKESKEAYQRLRKVLKYHLYEKRDGVIVNVLTNDEGELIEDPSEVNKLLLSTLKETQVDEKWGWIEHTDFPTLADPPPTTK